MSKTLKEAVTADDDLTWRRAVVAIAEYRDQYGITSADRALGDPPSGDIQRRAYSDIIAALDALPASGDRREPDPDDPTPADPAGSATVERADLARAIERVHREQRERRSFLIPGPPTQTRGCMADRGPRDHKRTLAPPPAGVGRTGRLARGTICRFMTSSTLQAWDERTATLSASWSATMNTVFERQPGDRRAVTILVTEYDSRLLNSALRRYLREPSLNQNVLDRQPRGANALLERALNALAPGVARRVDYANAVSGPHQTRAQSDEVAEGIMRAFSRLSDTRHATLAQLPTPIIKSPPSDWKPLIEALKSGPGLAGVIYLAAEDQVALAWISALALGIVYVTKPTVDVIRTAAADRVRAALGQSAQPEINVQSTDATTGQPPDQLNE